MSCDGPSRDPRFELEYVINDSERGRVKIQVYDRIGMDDLVLHLIERNLYRLVGGADPGDDINPAFKDFLVRENYLEII